MLKKSHKTFWNGGVEYIDAGNKDIPVKAPFILRTEGDIWPLLKGTAPFGSEQWGYQGSATTPYIITHYTTKRDGSVTEDGWACSCPNFTKKAVRTPCKHILNVMLKQGLGVKPSAAKMANVDDKKLAAFEKWEREQAAAKKSEANPTAGATLALFGATKRKFR